jgi:hypothetical protein
MSVWEFRFLQDGWMKANITEDEREATPPSEDEFFAAVERLG